MAQAKGSKRDSVSGKKVIEARCDRDSLAKALNSLAAAQTDTDLGWIQMQFTGSDIVVLSAMSHSLCIKYELKAAHATAGTIKVSGRQLIDYVKQLPVAPVEIHVDLPEKLTLKCEDCFASMQLVQDASSMDVQIPNVGTCVRVKGESLQQWLDTFREFVLVDDQRYYANGAYVWLTDASGGQGPQLCAVVSDSIRLAQGLLAEGIEVVAAESEPVLVPKKALDELRRIAAADPQRSFLLRWHKENLFFSVESDGYAMMSKCMAGKFPSYQAAIPSNIAITTEVDAKRFLEGIKRVLLFADKTKNVKMLFSGNTVTVQSATQGIREGRENIPLLQPVTSTLEIAYNGQLLISILSNIISKNARFEWEDIARPTKIVPDQKPGLSSFYLLLPSRF